MVKTEIRTANRDDWLRAALDVIHARGVEGVKVVALARTLNLTSGSFYWHFKNVQDLLDAVLEYWENQLTEHLIDRARNFKGSPDKRILNLMLQVIEEDASVPDSAIAVWAKSDAGASAAYQRTIKRRFEFAAFMFQEAGFPPAAARARGRMMVTALMGETANDIKKRDDWRKVIREQWKILMQGKT